MQMLTPATRVASFPLNQVDVIDYYDDAYAYSAYRAHSLPAVLRARAR